MRALGDLAPSPGANTPGDAPDGPAIDAPDGPAMTGLRSVAARIARTVRCIALVYIAVQVIIWHSFYAAGPWRLAGPAVAIAWGAAAVAYLRRRWPAWQLVGIDSGVYVVLALTAGWCVPAAMRGDAANWLFIAMQSQLIVAAWFAPGVVSAALALASGAAYWAGAELGPAGYGGNSPAAAAVLLIAIAAAHQCGRWMFYRRAAGADRALAQADADAREQYVGLSRNIERREHERLLHDTVLNTLTALARAGSTDPGSTDPGSTDPGSTDPGSTDPGSSAAGSADPGGSAAGGAAAGNTDAGEVVGRCRHDVTLMEFVLGDPGDPAKAAGRAYDGMVAAIEALAVEMRARGLDVHVAVASGAPGAGVDAPVVPVPVAVAIVRAVREALANVISHAGTAEAWVGVSPAAPGAGTAAAVGGVRVTVRDAGAGFDPASVDPARLGLRRSITERIADWGGRASIRSAPGEGTEVSLYWPGPGQSGPGQSGPGQPGPGEPGTDASQRRTAEQAGLTW
jgi:signal transduction histidine kinase